MKKRRRKKTRPAKSNTHAENVWNASLRHRKALGNERKSKAKG
jgi:hypothetical protein